MMVLLVVAMSLSVMIVLAVEHLLLLSSHSSDLGSAHTSGLAARYNELFLNAASRHLLLGLMNSRL
jgi:hypothetical protein